MAGINILHQLELSIITLLVAAYLVLSFPQTEKRSNGISRSYWELLNKLVQNAFLQASTSTDYFSCIRKTDIKNNDSST